MHGYYDGPVPTPEEEAEQEKNLAQDARVDALLVEHWETTGVQYQELQDAWSAAGKPDPDSGHPFWSTLQEDAWVAKYVAGAGGLTTAAARVALADAAPGAFIRDTGREPPHDLVARVFAALQR